MAEAYGLPRGSAINYGAPGFPPWVYDLAGRFGLKASTYPGHQENQRPDLKCAPNPTGQNRGIDWAGPPDNMLSLARWLRDTHPPGLEMVIYQDPRTGERVGYPTWVNYDSDYSGHRDHVHTRQSANLLGGGATPEAVDTLFADVSEWQRPVDDSYPYRVLSIRSNDGTYRDKNWVSNHGWCRRACDAGKLTFFIVYFVWRPNWEAAVATLKSQVGTPHPKMVVMLDVESWAGQITGDQSAGVNAAFESVAEWLGDRRRVIGYGNVGDLNNLWPKRPKDVRLVIAGYGNNPDYPGKIAHQYTDGQGYGGGLPEGAPPFGNCDMNSADGLTPSAFAKLCGIDAAPVTEPPPTEGGFLMALTDAEQREVLDLLRQQSAYRRISRSPLRMPYERETETISGFEWNTDGNVHVLLVALLARLGDPNELARLNAVASTDEPGREHDRLLAQAILNWVAGAVSDGGVMVPTDGPVGAVRVEPVVPAPPPAQSAPPATLPAPLPALPAVVSATPTGDGIRSAAAHLSAELEDLKGVLDALTAQVRS